MSEDVPTGTASPAVDGTVSFPRQLARTQRFTLGAPRGVHVSDDGRTALFLRSRAGTDAVTCLWRVDAATGEETLVADPRTLLGEPEDEDLPPEEQARRERLRESAAGVVAYAVDRSASVAAFALSGRLWLADVAAASCRAVPTEAPVVDPRPSPDGRHVAFVAAGALHVAPTDGSAPPRRVVGPSPDEPEVTWGLAEFVAAEEMNRFRGYWWSPTSDTLLVARVDESPVQVWHVSDPANPQRTPRATRYPAAGTPNADVTLWAVALDGGRREVCWDRDLFPYLTTVSWTDRGAPLLQVMDRAQQRARVLVAAVDEHDDAATDGMVRTSVRRELHDTAGAWVEVVPGSPTWSHDGRLLTVEAVGGATSLFVDGRPTTDERLQVRRVVHVDDGGAVVVATPTDEPTEQHAWRVPLDGAEPRRLVPDAGAYGTVALGGASAATSTLVTSTADWDRAARVEVRAGSAGPARAITSYAEEPVVTPRPLVVRSRVRGVVTAVYLPTDHEPGTPLPVLMSPYGGPHAQRVVAARNAHLESQWLADQGFGVVVADGRGTPRTPAWERAVRLDLATPVLDDQVEALDTAAEHVPDLDLTRVGIRGWSFGGYLAALAVLRRPHTFHAAVAGAPVTDWRLYDTFYTERYLGVPDGSDDAEDVYRRSSLLDDAHRLERPLLLVHGLADDNVVAAHTLRLSSALLAAGRPHEVLPLSGVTHMTPQEVVAENLLRLQVDFLRRHLT